MRVGGTWMFTSKSEPPMNAPFETGWAEQKS